MPLLRTASAFLLLTGSLAAQTAPDPGRLKQFAETGQRRSQLETEGAPAFHLKASFDDPQGRKVLVDMIWKDARHYREQITLGDHSMLEVDNGEQLWRTGCWSGSWEVFLAAQILLQPFQEFPADGRLTPVASAPGGPDMDCIATEPNLPGVAPETPLAQTTFCLAKNTHLLRTILRPDNSYIAFNDIKPFEGKYIARAIDISHKEKRVVQLHVDSLTVAEDLSSIDQPLPEGALKLSFHRADVPHRTSELMRGQMINAASIMGSSLGHEGTVIMKVRVGLTGEVESAEVVSSPSAFLNGPALTSAKRSRFRVSYQDGKPVAVDATINLTFRGRPE